MHSLARKMLFLCVGGTEIRRKDFSKFLPNAGRNFKQLGVSFGK
jgi:hypothetical protein